MQHRAEPHILHHLLRRLATVVDHSSWRECAQAASLRSNGPILQEPIDERTRAYDEVARRKGEWAGARAALAIRASGEPQLVSAAP